MKVLVVDNYDSFTYNLVYILRNEVKGKVDVVRNDCFTLEDVTSYDKIVLSPGPSLPKDAGLMTSVIETYGKEKSILGICLGHQGIVEVFGGELYNMPEVLHGYKGNLTFIDENEMLFNGIEPGVAIGQYHSWSAKEEALPACLKVTARCANNMVMAVSHQQFDVKGLQFHPESVLTTNGSRMITNWLNN